MAVITPEEIKSLINARKPEGLLLEFKRELPGNGDGDKKEFLADVSAFANAAGGILLYGIDEAEGAASDVVGVDSPDDDDELVRRLSSLVRDGIEPRISGYEVEIVSVEGKRVVALRVKQSFGRPHWVTLKGANRFYLRHAASKAPMSIDELRGAFMQGASAAERAAAWRAERVTEIHNLVSRRYVTIILHLVPLAAMSGLRGPTLSPADPHVREIPTVLYETANPRPNYFGAITSNSLGEDSLYDYVQIYRDYRLEAVFEGGVNPDGRAALQASIMEQRINEWLRQRKAWFGKVGYPFPALAFLSIASDKITTLMEGLRPATSPSLTLLFDEVYVEDNDFDSERAMRPAYDHLWQTYGERRSPNYNEEGQRVTRV